MQAERTSFGQVMILGNLSGFSRWPFTMASRMPKGNHNQKLISARAVCAFTWVVGAQIDEDMGNAGLPEGLKEGERCGVPELHQQNTFQDWQSQPAFLF